MRDERKRSIAEKIMKLVENVGDPRARGFKKERMIASAGIFYKFTDEWVDFLDNLIEELLKDGFDEKFSEKDIRSEIEGIISKIINDRDSENYMNI